MNLALCLIGELEGCLGLFELKELSKSRRYQ